MINIEELEKRKAEIIEELHTINTLRRGTLKEQYLKVPRKEKDASLRGPYYVFARNENGKTASVRINSPEELESVRKDIESYKRFGMITKELMLVIEKITDILRGGGIMLSKKNRKSTTMNAIRK